MGKYVDGFVIPLKVENIEAYREMSTKASEVWMELGALEYRECVGDDLDLDGVVSFKNAAGAREGETVIFAWIVYKSREDRDRVNKAIMEDPRIKEMIEAGNEPFDPSRMAYGGFRIIVEA